MDRRTRWLAVIVALCFIAVIEALSDSVLDPVLSFPLDTLVIVGTIAVAGIGFALFAFGRIDRLTSTLTVRNAELEDRNAALRAVYGVSLAVAEQSDLPEAIRSIADHAHSLLGADAALLVVQGDDGSVAIRAISPESAARDPVGKLPASADMPSTPLSADHLGRYLRPGLTVRIEAPIRRRDGTVGTLAVATREARTFTPMEIETLAALATQAGIALNAERFMVQLQELAVREERERIAREMHDGLAQVLAYVNTKSQAVEELLASGRSDEARAQLEELAAAARSVYVDVREAILSLSTPVGESQGLAAALRDYADRYAESSKLAVHCHIGHEVDEAQLPAVVQSEVFRICREALTNVRKHASAQRVTIALRVEGTALVLRVTDDGRGFDADIVGAGPENWPHFGLAGMRERAESIGGSIAWRSRPGAGTEIELIVPLEAAGERRIDGVVTAPAGTGTARGAASPIRAAQVEAVVAPADVRLGPQDASMGAAAHRQVGSPPTQTSSGAD